MVFQHQHGILLKVGKIGKKNTLRFLKLGFLNVCKMRSFKLFVVDWKQLVLVKVVQHLQKPLFSFVLANCYVDGSDAEEER